MAVDYTERTREILDGISGDDVSSEATPVVVAQLLHAQALATLAVADAVDRLTAHLEDRAITVRSE